MKKNKYTFLISTGLLLVMVLCLAFFFQYIHKINLFPGLFTTPVKTKSVNIFGIPQKETGYAFPKTNPEFNAIIGTAKPSTVKQQSITIYSTTDKRKETIFQRGFYADGFHGNELTYTLSSNSASFIQSGSLRRMGCGNPMCSMPWSNFYTRDAKQKKIVLDNVSHKDFFADLLTQYQAADALGCSIQAGHEAIPKNNISLTELYTKHASHASYCNKDQGILPENLVFFLQTEKALQEITGGKNMHSTDIQTISL